jgi:hypothetical protein
MHSRIRELLDHLDAERAVLRQAFEEVPPDLRERAPAPGRWSPAGIIEHLAIVEQRVARQLAEKIAAARAEGVGSETGEDPVLPSLDLTRIRNRETPATAHEATHPKGLSADAAWAALEQAGETLRATLRSGDGLALGSIEHPHPRFGSISVYHWVAILGSHEARHAAQIREDAAAARA